MLTVEKTRIFEDAGLDWRKLPVDIAQMPCTYADASAWLHGHRGTPSREELLHEIGLVAEHTGEGGGMTMRRKHISLVSNAAGVNYQTCVLWKRDGGASEVFNQLFEKADDAFREDLLRAIPRVDSDLDEVRDE